MAPYTVTWSATENVVFKEISGGTAVVYVIGEGDHFTGGTFVDGQGHEASASMHVISSYTDGQVCAP